MKPAQPPHKRKLALMGTALTLTRNHPLSIAALAQVRDELECVLINSDFYRETPFSWITIAIRYGLTNDIKPRYQPINKKYGDLPLSIEVSIEEMKKKDLEGLKMILKKVALLALIDAGVRYGSPVSDLQSLLTDDS